MATNDDLSSTSALSSRPLYDSTFSLFRLSPLHLPRNVTASSFSSTLPTHSQRLTEHLQRDPHLAPLGPELAGVIEYFGALHRAGKLQRTRWTWMSSEGGPTGPEEEEDNNATNGTTNVERRGGPDGLNLLEGLRIDIEFVRAEYTALFLRRADSIGSTSTEDARLSLPLALLAMPNGLLNALIPYLAAHFDARMDPVKVPEQTIAGALEVYLAVLAPATSQRSQDDDDESRIAKDVQLSIALPGPELRSLDATIRAKDVEEFMKRGSRRFNRSTSGAGERGFATGPFTSAMASYLSTHLALDCTNSAVNLARVACGAFALGREGKVKIFPPGSAGEGGEVLKGIVDVLWELVKEDRE